MSDARKTQQLALQGGMKSVTTIEGRGEPKIGVAEFLSIAERFGLKRDTLSKIKAVVEEAGMGEGPFLANYYSGLKESKVQAYERVAREIFGVKHSIGASSGTGALHAAFVAAGVGPGKEVIVPAVGFFATAAAVVMAKGVPVFCDVDASLGMDPTKLEALVTPRTVAIAPTCVMGAVPAMGPIMKIARRHNLRVIEDVAQACGATYDGQWMGTIGDFGCFSISAYKIFGGGEGGLLLTNDQRLWERASNLIECGGLWRPDRFAPPRYENEIWCGTNYRMSELEAAVDVVQLKKIKQYVKRFRAVRLRILKQLETFREITPQKINDIDGEVGYTLRFFPESVEQAEKIAAALGAEGVPAGARGRNAGPDWHVYHYLYPVLLRTSPDGGGCPFTCPAYEQAGGQAQYDEDACPVAKDLFERMVSISLNQWYTAGDCKNIAAGINKVLRAYCTPDPAATAWL